MLDLRVVFEVLKFILDPERHHCLLEARNPLIATAGAKDRAQFGSEVLVVLDTMLTGRILLDPVGTLNCAAKPMKELIEHRRVQANPFAVATGEVVGLRSCGT